MLANPQPPRIHLPKAWQDCVKSAVLHGINARVRLAAENDRLHEELALLREELRIKDAGLTSQNTGTLLNKDNQCVTGCQM